MNNTAPTQNGSPELRAAIGRFCRRRGIEAASALSLIALTSFSQSWALSVGELNVNSALGQPLRATLDINTASGEFINARCLRLSSPNDPDMPGVRGVRLAVSTQLNTTTLRFSGNLPMREPMSEMVLKIDCAGTPAFTRSFLVMLDPPSLLATAPVTPTLTQSPVLTPALATRRNRIVRSTRSPISAGSDYVIRPGDILSVIASRVADRPDYSVWPIAQRIYDMNPAAFDSHQPDSLRVGATLSIPALTGSLAVVGSRDQVRTIRLRAASSADRRNGAAVTNTSTPAATRTTRRTLPLPAPQQPVALTRPNPVPRAAVVRDMAYTRDFSRISMDRLRQRRAGNPHPLANVVNEAPVSPTPEPVAVAPSEAALKTRSPAPAPVYAPTAVNTERGGTGSWLFNGLALLLGALLGTLGTGLALRRWLATQKEEQENEIARAKRHQARLDETRQTRTDKTAPSIVVHEELPRVDIGGPMNIDAVGSVEEVIAAGTSSAAIGALLESDAAAEVDDDSLGELSEDTGVEPALSVDSIEHEADLNYDVFDKPNDNDLALLERDYASTSGDVSELEPDVDFGETMALLAPEQLGMIENATEIIASPLDLELPQGDDDDTELSIAALKKETEENFDDSSLDVGLTDAAIQLDADLMNLAQSLPEDSDPTAEAQLLSLGDSELDDDPTSAIKTRDSEDFYHLEASSIRKVDALAFEQDIDDDDTQLVSMLK